MLDKRMLNWTRPLQLAVARRLHRAGVSANQVTLAGFGVGVLVVPLLAFGHAGWAVLAILGNRLLDGVDGTLARLNGPTDRGGYLDIVLDFLFYSAVPLGFALSDPAVNALPAAVLIYAFVGTGSSFLAFGVFAAKRGLTSTAYPNKSFYYLGGLTEATETIGLFLLMCLWPAWFGVLAYGFAALCGLTTVLRLQAGWQLFVGEEGPPAGGPQGR